MKEITRLVVDGWPSPGLKVLENWLLQSVQQLKLKKERTKFLVTPGGFAIGKFPKNWEGGCGWESSDKDLSELIPFAIPIVDKVVSKRLLKAAAGFIKYITLNVDLRSKHTALHAELVAVIDVASGKIIGWTGKSYPTMSQEKKIVRATDPSTHLFELGADRVVILGCHDLNIFNGRARANQKRGGHRDLACRKMLQCFNEFKPTHIIQHPHGTDTWRSWNQSWKQVSRQFPGVCWSSAITYAANKGERRAPLQDVLDRTHYEGSESLNFIVKGRSKRTMLQRSYVPVAANS